MVLQAKISDSEHDMVGVINTSISFFPTSKKKLTEGIGDYCAQEGS